MRLPKPQLEPVGSPDMVYKIESESRVGVTHFVFLWGDHRGVTCTCEAAQFGRHCKHVDMVELCQSRAMDITDFLDNTGIIRTCHRHKGHTGACSWERAWTNTNVSSTSTT